MYKHSWARQVYAVVKPLFTPVVMVALLTEVAIGQTFFELRNIAFNRVNAPVLDASGVPLASTNFLAELWGSGNSTTLAPA